MLPVPLDVVGDKTPKWLKPVIDGKRNLNIFYLAGVEKDAEGNPTNWSPPVQCARGPIRRVWYDKFNNGEGLDPPHQPHVVAVEGHNLSVEDVLKSWMDTFPGVGGLKLTPIKIFENFAYTESSQLHGNMLQKESFQKNQAKELLATIQNIKTAILNIESDLEKLDEQISAFQDGDWEKIKWLFIDNYGGPDRSWTAVARQVPLVRMSMTWFLRLSTKEKAPFENYMKALVEKSDDKARLGGMEKEIEKVCKANKKDHLKQIDALVKEEQMNPAIGNHLKSKIEEFWNWVTHYSSWLKKSRDRVMANIVYQKTNLKMYMKWAADAIQNAERLKMDATTMENIVPDFSFKHTPREMTSMEYIFAADEGRPEIMERCRPWVPVVLTHVDITSTVELQKKFAGVVFFNMNGYIRKDDLQALKAHLSEGKGNLVNTMISSGAMTEEEIKKIFDEKELKVLKGEGGPEVKFDAKEKWRMQKLSIWNLFINSMRLFGIEVRPDKYNLDWTYNMRAAGYAYDLMVRGIEMFKKSNGLFTFE